MKISEHYPLSDFLWYKIGGNARYFIQVAGPDDIPPLLAFLQDRSDLPVFICGLGSNLVFKDEDFEGIVLAIEAPTETKPRNVTDDGQITVFAGDTMDTAIKLSFEHGLLGLEWAGGLPGTVGAGIRGNVGAFGGEIKDSVYSVDVISLKEPKRGIVSLLNDELRFSYRHSFVKENPELLVISATFQLTAGTNVELEQAKQIYEKNKAYRKENHPLEYPNCGSVFKNIKRKNEVERVLSVWPEIREKVEKSWYGKVSMGFVINQLGLRGYRIGNAQISEKHSNFIINLGDAKASDVRAIISEVQNRSEKLFGFRPEVEVEIVR